MVHVSKQQQIGINCHKQTTEALSRAQPSHGSRDNQLMTHTLRGSHSSR